MSFVEDIDILFWLIKYFNAYNDYFI